MRNKPSEAPERVAINVRLPAALHRAAKVQCAAEGLTWDEAVTRALQAWVERDEQRHAPRGGHR